MTAILILMSLWAAEEMLKGHQTESRQVFQSCLVYLKSKTTEVCLSDVQPSVCLFSYVVQVSCQQNSFSWRICRCIPLALLIW